jgi:ABC-2 type transport system ATP-binding protein
VEDIRKILMDLKKKGKLILLASHNPLDIDILCDCVYELDAGTIVNQRSILPR